MHNFQEIKRNLKLFEIDTKNFLIYQTVIKNSIKYINYLN